MGLASYEWDTTRFVDSVNITVVEWNASHTTGRSYQVTMRIAGDTAAKRYRPEQVYRKEFTSQYWDVHGITVTINNIWKHNSAGGAQDSAVYLEAWFTDELAHSAHNSADPQTPMLRAVAPLYDSISNNPVTFTWERDPACADSFPNYELQLLRLYGQDVADTITAPGEAEHIHTLVDWRNALSVVTGNGDTSLTLTLAEGTGYYAWRVRPIGTRYPGGIANDRNWGVWSPHAVDGADIYLSWSASMQMDSGTFYYRQFDDGLNWIYSRAFVEGDSGTRVGESMVYASTLLQPRQSQALRHTKDTILISGVYVDYSGRPVLSTLVAPDAGTGFGYRTNLLESSYSASNFDDDGNWNDPQSVGSGILANYYSDSNIDGSIPSAGGYPFSRVIYLPDGTGRVYEQSGVGDTHRIRPSSSGTPRTTRTLYGSVSDRELIRLFGDEAPAAETVHKVAVTDPNGVANISFIGTDGGTIATCLSKDDNADALETLEGEVEFSETVKDTVHGNMPYGPDGIISGKTLIFTEPTTLYMSYLLSPETFGIDCNDFCLSCDYNIHFRVRSALDPTQVLFHDSIDVSGAECSSASEHLTWNNSVALGAGMYVVERTVQVNNKDSASITVDDPIGRTFLEQQIDSLRARSRSDIENRLSGVYAWLDSLDHDRPYALDSLHSYLSLEFALDSGIYTMLLGCCTIQLPQQSCGGTFPCDTNNLIFEDFLLGMWGRDTSRFVLDESGDTLRFASTINGYVRQKWAGGVRVPDIDSNVAFPNGTGLINTLVRNMVRDGWDCQELWKCWRSAVVSWGSIATRDGSGDPRKRVNEVDIIDVFLTCAGRRLEGYTTTGYGNDSVPGYLTHAHRYFYYVPCAGDASPPCYCEDSLGLNPSGWGPTDTLQWDSLFICSRSLNRHFDLSDSLIPSVCFDSTGADSTCLQMLADSLMNDCRDVCEAERPAIVAELVRQHHLAGRIVERDLYAPDGITPLPADTTYDVSWWEIVCAADRLVDECKAGCTLTLFANDSGHVDSIGSTAEKENFERSMTYRMDLQIPTGGDPCDSGYIALGANSMLVRNLVIDDLNRRLNLQRGDVGILGGWFDLKGALRQLNSGFADTFTGDSLVWVRPEGSERFVLDTCYTIEFCACYITYLGDTTVCNDSGYVNPLVDSLNSYLDRVWGMVAPSSGAIDTCSAADDSVWVRTFIADSVSMLREIRDSLGSRYTPCVNGRDSLQINSILQLLPRSSTTINAFRTGGDSVWRFAYAGVVIESDSVKLEVYPNCEGFINSDGNPLQHMPLQYTLFEAFVRNNVVGCDTVALNIAASTYPSDTVGSSREVLEYLFGAPYTQRIGRFAEDAEGYLIYIIDTTYLRLHSGYLPVTRDTIRLCSIRFYSTTTRTFSTGICDSLECSAVCYRWQKIDPDSISHGTDTLSPKSCPKLTGEYYREYLRWQVEECIQRQVDSARAAYRQKCADPASVRDTFELRYGLRYYHFTLFYYDRAGNVVRTVPPAGVQLTASTRMDTTQHKLITRYEYNSLGWMERKYTPDADTTRYWHDRHGRIRFAQTARQRTLPPPRYSYSRYDRLGRTVESGEAMFQPYLDLAEHLGDSAFPSLSQQPIVDQTLVFYSAASPRGDYLGDTQRPQRYLLNRVSYTLRSIFNETPDDDSVMTSYSYDPHGNVEWMSSYAWGLGENFIRYDYDLYSGNLKELIYNEGTAEEYRQRYSFNLDNQIEQVSTSRNGVIWDRDARYLYYAYGPLRRVEVGEDSLQGIDYTYTIQGWLKGINHPALWYNRACDPGGDSTAMDRASIPADAFGMLLQYYDGDFTRSGLFTMPTYTLTTRNLFNGNISGWSTSIQASGAGGKKYEYLTGTTYTYDVLNRLLDESFQTNDNYSWSVPGGNQYWSHYRYDPNGNLDSLSRNGYTGMGGVLVMDRLKYRYVTGTNRLRRVNDSVSATATSVDIDDQGTGTNYEYDGSGNLTRDVSEGTWVKWNSQGKVVEVLKRAPLQLKGLTMKYLYNPAGNRIRKIMIDNNDTMASRVTYYVRDANEQVIAIYEGYWHPTSLASTCTTMVIAGDTLLDSDCDSIPDAYDNCRTVVNRTTVPGQWVQTDTDGDGIGDTCDCNSAIYDPWSEDFDRDGFADICDPCPYDTANGGGCPQIRTRAMNSPHMLPYGLHLAEWHIYGSAAQGRVAIAEPDSLISRSGDTTALLRTNDTTWMRSVRYKNYELKDHLGNVRATISDIKKHIPPIGPGPGGMGFVADLRSYQNYYAFGMLQPGRSWSGDSSRYGYNGKEKDNEVKGSGNEYDYGFRIYDPRIARFLSEDPLTPE